MEKSTLIRTIYLYLFALLGLVLMTIGGVNLLDLGLKATLFTGADADQRGGVMPPSPFPLETYQREVAAAAPETRAALESWATEYRRWESTQKNVDYLSAYRQREAAQALAMILVGLPLYFYHWRTIRRESGERKQAAATA